MRLFGQLEERWIHLDQLFLLGSGGEGNVYPILNDSALAAKLYHNETRTDRADKLRAMLRNPPVQAGRNGHTSIAWPSDLLSWEPGGPVVGYLMPRVRHARVIDDYYNPPTRLEHCPLFHYEYLLCVARNLTAAVRSLHTRGYVIGDVKQANILVTPNALVTLVDTDSFQVRDEESGRLFRCPVCTPEYTPPELQDQKVTGALEPEHDLFGLAVLIFQLLMEGSHPFAGVYAIDEDPPPLGERIRLGHFPYRYSQRPPAIDETQTFMRQQSHFAPSPRAVPCSPSRKSVAFEVLPPELRSLFFQCFDDGYSDPGLRPSAQTWLDALDRARASLNTCNSNSQHRYSSHLSQCPWCERMHSQLRGHDPFPSREAVEARPPSAPAIPPLPNGVTHQAQPVVTWKHASAASAQQPLGYVSGPAKQHSFWGPALFIGAVFSILGFLSLNFSPSTETPRGYDPSYYRTNPPYAQPVAPLREADSPAEIASAIHAAVLSADGKTVALSTNRLSLRSTETGRPIVLFPLAVSSGDFARSLYLSHDATSLAGIYNDGACILVTGKAWTNTQSIGSEDRPVRALDISANKKFVAVAEGKDENEESMIRLINTESSSSEGFFKTDYGETIACVRFTPDGKRLLATTSGANNASTSWRLYCWSISTGKRLWTRSDIASGASLAMSPDGSELAIGGAEIQLRRIQNGEPVDFSSMRGDVLGYSPGGDWLAISASFRVMLLQKKPPFLTVEIPTNHVISVAFPGNNRVMTMSSTDGIETWNMKTGERLHSVPMYRLRQ